ncbi:MAG TPA: lysine--tRNA ligase [Candidatus Paceibacterota bacterium]
MNSSIRFDFGTVPAGVHWADALADAVIAQKPDETLYTCAAGISPSGPVHFGNFRDIITAHAVAEALKKKGKKARLLFSWDNFDRLRKVPAGVPESFAGHIGKPLSKVPDPMGELASYAERFQKPFVKALEVLGIELEYRNQTALYEAGTYDEQIFFALGKRKEIADILLSFMTEKGKGEKGIEPKKYREEYYPISLYSRFTGKDNTKILSYDGGTKVTYYCADSKNTEEVDLAQEHIAKLAWKIDWAMRWKFENVSFEPAGHDHASPGGSFDVSSTIDEKIFGYVPPINAEYKFVGIQGGGAKMSGSKGNAVTPSELLEIYEPGLLKWMYLRRSPDQSFSLAFDSEIYRQYDEYDLEVSAPAGKHAIPFRQAVGFGQIVGWHEDKLMELLKGMELSYDAESIAERIPRANAWLTKYNPEERIELLTQKNESYAAGLSEDARKRIEKLHRALPPDAKESIADLEALVYEIPKEGLAGDLKLAQRNFFKDAYTLLIGRDTGPRLGTFLWAVDRKKILDLLDI